MNGYSIGYSILNTVLRGLPFVVLPLAISLFRKKAITHERFTKAPNILAITVCVLFIVLWIFSSIFDDDMTVFDDEMTAGIVVTASIFLIFGVVLWTSIGVAIGGAILKKRGLMVSEEEYEEMLKNEETEEEKTHPVLAVILGIIAVGILIFIGVIIGVSI